MFYDTVITVAGDYAGCSMNHNKNKKRKWNVRGSELEHVDDCWYTFSVQNTNELGKTVGSPFTYTSICILDLHNNCAWGIDIARYQLNSINKIQNRWQCVAETTCLPFNRLRGIQMTTITALFVCCYIVSIWNDYSSSSSSHRNKVAIIVVIVVAVEPTTII